MIGFFHPPLLNLAMQPKGNDNNKSIKCCVWQKRQVEALFVITRLSVENASSKKIPFKPEAYLPASGLVQSVDYYDVYYAYDEGLNKIF